MKESRKDIVKKVILKQLSAGTSSGNDANEATPMAVDRIYHKGGKGKDKGKKGEDGKGKGWWNNMWQFPGGRGRGKGRGKRKGKGDKGKGKSKGKKGGKSKHKGNSKSGKGKGSKRDPCFICGSYDHWSRECPRKVNNVNNVYYDWDGNEVNADTILQNQQSQQPQSVQNVQQSGSSSSTTYATTQNSSTPQRSSAGSSSVRRVYDLGLENNPFSVTRMVVDVGEPEQCLTDVDFFYDWFEGWYDIDSNLCVIDEDISLSPVSDAMSVDECLHVRAMISEVPEPQHERSCIILNSGSDVSLLPMSFVADSDSTSRNHNLRDCQGQRLQTSGTKDAELIVDDISNGQAILKQQFIVGDVTNCLLSLGQMMKKGWTIGKTDECNSGIALISPDEQLKIPVEYKGDSLAITAFVRCVSDDTDILSVPHDVEPQSEPLWVQTVLIKVQEEFDLTKMRDWQLSETGTPYLIQRGRRFVDPRHMWGRYWPYRSTLIRQIGTSEWCCISWNWQLHWIYLWMFAWKGLWCFDDCGSGPTWNLLIGSSSEEQPIVGIAEIPEVEGDADQGAEAPVEEVGPVAAPQLEGVIAQDEVVINDVVLKPTSSVRDLPAAAKYLGVSQAGSKLRMFERICSCHILALRRRSLELAEQAYQQEEVQPRETYSSTRQPSERERRLHEITHLPFRQWCPFCVAGKSRADYKHPVEAEDVQQREFPVIQLDIMFSPGGNSVLLLIDTWTRYIFSAAMKTKSAKIVSTSISEFLGILGYFRKIEIVSDNEPVIVSGIKQAQILRARSGLETIVQKSKAFDKGRTAVAERAIQTVRSQARTLVNYVEHQIEAKFPDGHPIHMWALLHSAWLLNRFHRHSALGCAPYQSLFGRPYKGRVANFGQDMYGISQKKTKYKAQWTRGVWVGKDHADQDMLIIENDKILKSKAVRATGLFRNKNDLVNMEVTPDHLLKIATQTKGVYPVIPPLQCLPPRSDDEAASDPPEDQGGGDSQVPPLIPIPMSAKVRDNVGPRLPIQQRSPLNQQELSQLPFSAGMLPEGGDGPTKWVLESDESRRESKQSKVQSYSEKHQATEVLEEREPKQIKTGLQSSPTFAGNIRYVADYGGVDVYVEPDEDSFEFAHEECFLHLEDELGAGDDDGDEFSFSEQQENDGPPKLTDEELAQLDHDASLEELVRQSNMGVISEYGNKTGEEMVLDTRLWLLVNFEVVMLRTKRHSHLRPASGSFTWISCACIGATVKCAGNGCQGRIPYSTTARSCHHWDTHLGEVKWHDRKRSWFLEAGEMPAWSTKGSIALAWAFWAHSQQVWLHSFWGHGDSVQAQGQTYVHHNTCWWFAHHWSSGRLRMVQIWNFQMLHCKLWRPLQLGWAMGVSVFETNLDLQWDWSCDRAKQEIHPEASWTSEDGEQTWQISTPSCTVGIIFSWESVRSREIGNQREQSFPWRLRDMPISCTRSPGHSRECENVGRVHGMPDSQGYVCAETSCSISQEYHGVWSCVVQVWTRRCFDGSSIAVLSSWQWKLE